MRFNSDFAQGVARMENSTQKKHGWCSIGIVCTRSSCVVQWPRSLGALMQRPELIWYVQPNVYVGMRNHWLGRISKVNAGPQSLGSQHPVITASLRWSMRYCANRLET